MKLSELKAIDKLNEEMEFKNLNVSEKMEDSIGEFAVLHCIHEDDIIVGNLSQTYEIDLTKFSDNSKEEVPIDEDRANDNRTYFL